MGVVRFGYMIILVIFGGVFKRNKQKKKFDILEDPKIQSFQKFKNEIN